MSNSVAALIKEVLPGDWQFERCITGYQPITGSATFTPTDNSLRYYEELSFPTKDGKLLGAYREYIYEFEGDRLKIYFCFEGKRGDLFLNMPLDSEKSAQGIEAQASHLCKEDLYEALFRFGDDFSFSVQYKVTGPAKDYLIVTRYLRALEAH